MWRKPNLPHAAQEKTVAHHDEPNSMVWPPEAAPVHVTYIYIHCWWIKQKSVNLYHVLVSYHAFFSRLKNILEIIISFLWWQIVIIFLTLSQINRLICNRHSQWDDMGPFDGIRTHYADLSIPSFSSSNLRSSTWPRPNDFTSFNSKRQVILAKTHSDTTHKELYMLGWCCRAHKARYHRRYLACSFAELVSRRGFQNMNHISTPYRLFGEESSRYFHDIILEQRRGWRAAEKEMDGNRRWSSCPESERQEAISHVLRDVS